MFSEKWTKRRMTPQEAETSPQRNVLLQCVGASQYVVPDFSAAKYNPENPM